MDKDIAISVKNVSKTFRIPHEKVSSVRGAMTSAFKKKSFEEFKALDDISFEVKKGEFFGIIGRNGSGKSTLLKILAGIYQSDKGSIKINGRISPFLELGIGFNPELSGRDNVYLNATVLGLTKKEIDKKFDDIVKFSELERFIDQKLKNYSSGMQVRLAFSVSIHANREILLMDEVLAVGDSNFQSKCLEEFNKYKEQGKTVILVSHDIATIQRYCDRAMLVRNGKIIKIGKADEVASAYIYKNIIDEKNSELLQEKLNDKGSISKTSKNAVFQSVELLDNEEKDISLVEYDQDVILRFKINIRENIENLVFGYHIRDLNGLDIVYSDSIIEDLKFTNLIMGQSYVIDWRFKMSLLHGSYKIACVLSVPVDLKRSLVDFCDFMGSAVEFQVLPRENSFLYGKVHIANNVKISIADIIK